MKPFHCISLGSACLAVCAQSATAQTDYSVEALNSPQTAGVAVNMRVTARAAGSAVPFFKPSADIVITANSASVRYNNASGGFPLTDNEDGTATVSAAGLNTFDINGRFTFDVTNNKAESVTLNLNDGTLTGDGASTWIPGLAHHLAFSVHATGGTTASNLTPIISMRDQFENIVTGDARTIVLNLGQNPTGANLSGGLSVLAVNGFAAWTAVQQLRVSAAGNAYTLVASHSGAPFAGTDTVESNAFNISEESGGEMQQDDPPEDDPPEDDPSDDGTQEDESPDDEGDTGGSTPPADDLDSDGDGTPDSLDPEPDEADSDGDGVVDGLERDTDNDGLVDALDPAPNDPDADDDGIQDGNDNCVQQVNADQADGDGDGMGDACEDNDGDGVANGVEDEAPNDGDGNADGIPDRDQAGVASLSDDSGSHMTLVAPSGVNLEAVILLPNPSPANTPEGLSFPLGFIQFRLTNLPAAGVTADVLAILNLAPGIVINSYYNFGPSPDKATPDWYEFTVSGFGLNPGAIIAGELVTLRLKDGGRGDDDLVANGVVSSLGAPAIKPVSGCGFGCGTGLFPVFGITAVSFTISLLRRKRAAATKRG